MKAQIVSFHCVLKNKLGQTLSSSFNQDVINQIKKTGSHSDNQKLRGLIAGIQNVHNGERRQFTVTADDAYGPYDPDLILNVLRSDLLTGDDLVIGSEIVSQSGPNDSRKVFRVVQMNGEILVLDGNHPLAGQDLIFDIEVVSAREASSDDFDETFSPAPGQYLH
jgi:FKBP-type peptidyl-prolyl cis-trans isomerase SlyD